MKRMTWAAALCALGLTGGAWAQSPPDGYRVRIGPADRAPSEDPLAPPPDDSRTDGEPDEVEGAPSTSPVDAPDPNEDAQRDEHTAPASGAAEAGRRTRRARPKRRALRWDRGETVTPLEAAHRLEATPGEAIEFAHPLTFRHDSVEMTPNAAPALAEIVDYLQASPEIRLVLIEGHSDATGALRYNQRLSEARAAAVREALVTRGVAPERLVAYGYGETRPAAPDREANRRVVFRVIEGDRKALVRRVATEWGQVALVDGRGAVEVADSPESNADRALEPESAHRRDAPASQSADRSAGPPTPDPRRPDGAFALHIAPPAAAPTPQPVTPVAISRSGGPDLPDDALSWRAFEARSQIGEGHDIRTDRSGWALLRLPDLSRLWLGPGTRVRLSKLFHDRANGKTYVSLRVRRGTVRAMLNPLERSISRSLIALPGGSLEAVAADFEIQLDHDATGRLRVDRGRLDAAGGGAASRAIYAGQVVGLGVGDGAPRAQLPPPSVVSPRNGRFGRAPPLVWQPVADAAGYIVEVAEDVDFHRPVLRARTTPPRFEPRVLTPDREHYWRVRAVSREGLPGAASRVHAFRTAPRRGTPPAAARLDVPDGAR